MSREILFKAKRKKWRDLPKEEQWVYGYYVSGFNIYEEQVHIIFDPTTIFCSKGETDGWDEIDPETICQYTGLKDKNGKKIWENDLVKYPDCEMSTEAGYGDCFENVGSVQWDAESMSFFFTDRVTVDMGDIIINDEVEVIGNIFDNPELLKGSGLNE